MLLQAKESSILLSPTMLIFVTQGKVAGSIEGFKKATFKWAALRIKDDFSNFINSMQLIWGAPNHNEFWVQLKMTTF